MGFGDGHEERPQSYEGKTVGVEFKHRAWWNVICVLLSKQLLPIRSVRLHAESWEHRGASSHRATLGNTGDLAGMVGPGGGCE